MTPRVTALALAAIAIGLTLAQVFAPAREWYHSWQYIVVLALAIVVMVGYALGARRGEDGPTGRRFALALAGATATAVAGLLSGLIGPDTVTVVGTPGTVTPVLELGGAAFFGAVDATAIARGDATVTLRQRGEAPIEFGARPSLLDLSVVTVEQRPAAYVVARDLHGNRVTVTQPTNPSFLSPVILFRQQQTIRDKTFPMDTFAAPAVHRVARVLYFSAADLTAFRHGLPGAPNQPGAVLSIADDAGNARGITIAASGTPIVVGDLNVTVTLGTYPVLVIASAPQPAVMYGGIALFVLGCIWALVPAKSATATEAASTPAAGADAL